MQLHNSRCRLRRLVLGSVPFRPSSLTGSMSPELLGVVSFITLFIVWKAMRRAGTMGIVVAVYLWTVFNLIGVAMAHFTYIKLHTAGIMAECFASDVDGLHCKRANDEFKEEVNRRTAASMEHLVRRSTAAVEVISYLGLVMSVLGALWEEKHRYWRMIYCVLIWMVPQIFPSLVLLEWL
jgi:hypothetical protein